MSDQPHPPQILIEGLSKSFKNMSVLRGVTLDVSAGECVALLGRNGAGKSTLIRILAGIITPDSGRVLVGGHDVERDRGSSQASQGHLFGDERAWFWRLTGRQNLEFFAVLYGIPRARVRTRCAEVLEEAGLTHVGDRPFGTYSSGMRLRLGIARALLHNPSVLILDEPSRTLDIPSTRHLWEQIRNLAARGTAILLATHDAHEAIEVADRRVLLHDGIAVGLAPAADAADLERAVLEIAGDEYHL